MCLISRTICAAISGLERYILGFQPLFWLKDFKIKGNVIPLIKPQAVTTTIPLSIFPIFPDIADL
jgi:hypothetical protein